MRQPHSSCKKGKMVRIILKDGSKYVTRFVETVGQHVRTEAGDFLKGDIKVFAIYKPLPHEL